MNYINMSKRGSGRRTNSGKLFTDVNEYLEELEKTEKAILEKGKMRARGRPKQIPDYPEYLVRTYGEYILNFD